jgi:hypothetical protein
MKFDLLAVQQLLLNEISKSFSDVQQLNREKLVYLLVQIRKVLEISDVSKDDRFIILTFFIDWALHPRKNKNKVWYESIKKKVILSIDNSRQILMSKGLEREIDINAVWSHEFHTFITLSGLKENLKFFSDYFKVNLKTLFELEKFDLFREVMMEVLSESPIEIEDDECPINAILIQSNKNKTKFSQEKGMAKHVCDYVLLYKNESLETVSFLDGTVPMKGETL